MSRDGWYRTGTENLCVCHPEWPGICTPQDLYDALCEVWCPETCAPRMRSEWSEQNRTMGQCSVTAFLAQDIFGGRVYGIPLGDGNYHCYNEVDGAVFDLTCGQFAKPLEYRCEHEQSRETHFAKEEKRLRYLLLQEKLKAWCSASDAEKHL